MEDVEESHAGNKDDEACMQNLLIASCLNKIEEVDISIIWIDVANFANIQHSQIPGSYSIVIFSLKVSPLRIV